MGGGGDGGGNAEEVREAVATEAVVLVVAGSEVAATVAEAKAMGVEAKGAADEGRCWRRR